MVELIYDMLETVQDDEDLLQSSMRSEDYIVKEECLQEEPISPVIRINLLLDKLRQQLDTFIEHSPELETSTPQSHY